jgi:hypothetical protein
VTLGRNQLVLLLLIAVVGTAVAVGVYYIENVYKKREEFLDKVKKGETEDLIEKPPPAPTPSSPPPSQPRPTDRREAIALVIKPAALAASSPTSRPALSQKVVTIRGNGEFMRIPSLPGETGPLVSGILDRAQVDELFRAVLDGAEMDAERGSEFSITAITAAGKPGRARDLNRAGARKFLELAGKSMNRSASPEQVWLKVETVDEQATTPWPFQRAAPESFARGGLLKPEADKVRFREGVLRLVDPSSRFSSKDKTWRVSELNLLP